MSDRSFAAWKDKLAWGVVAGAVGWAAYFSIEVWNRPTTSEVKGMIRSQAPYIEDRNMIMNQIEANEKVSERLLQVIDKNTDAINLLRVQLVEFAKETDR